MVTVREAVASDASAFLNLMRTIGGESDNLVTTGDGLPFSVEQEEAYLHARHNTANCVTFLAFDEGRLVGCAGCDTPSSPRVCHGGELGMAVLKSYWGKGVGSLLLSTLIEWAKREETGLTKLSLTVRADNLRAISLYRRFGFVEEGKVSRMLRIDGLYHDGVSMVLLLD